MQHLLSAILQLLVQVLVVLQYPLLFAALLLAWSSIQVRCIYGKFPISFPTFFFSAGTSPQARDKCWAETVVHPVLLWHPFSRKVLISGSGTRTLVEELLRHVATTPIHWIDSSSPHLTTNDDILQRTIRHRIPYSSGNSTFDVIILDGLVLPEHVSKAAMQLSSGGVLALALGDHLGEALPKVLSLFKHVHVFLPYNSAGRSSHYAIATNSDYPPPTHFSVPYINTLIGRRIVPRSSLEHYDGEVHLRIFLLPRQIRDSLREVYQKSVRPASTFPNLSHWQPHKEKISCASYPTAITSTQDFVLCASLPLSDSLEKDATGIVLDALKNGEANQRDISSRSWNEYQNITTYHVPPGVDTATIRVSPVLDSSTPSDSLLPAQLTITAIFDGGSLSLHILPHLRLARASITNFNGWVSSKDIFDYLSVRFDPERVTGSQYAGPPHFIQYNTLDGRLSHFGDRAIGSINHWELKDPCRSWSSPKVALLDSPVAGKGNWARENISKGEMVFKEPIEPVLCHFEEYKLYPEWKKSYTIHYCEQVHDEIFAAGSKARENLSYFINHACSPNLRYDDTYDEMVAIRDIPAGEELTFDYATVSGHSYLDMECRCGGPSCRRKVISIDWQDEGIVSRLGKEAFWPFLKAKILKMEKDRMKK